MRRTALLAAGAAVSAALLGVATTVPAQATGSGDLPPDLQAVRAATAVFHSVDQAVAAGYQGEGEPCTASPAGTMGIHYVNFSLFGAPLDPLRPQAVLYVPGDDGSRKLVAVEYAAVDADQNLATDDDRPSLFGQPFDGPMPGHAPGMPIHYDLHVWIWADNPAGLFAQWNPSVSC